MKINEQIYLVGSGSLGFSITHPIDCNLFLIDTGAGCMLIDSGVGLDPQRIETVVCSHGFGMGDIKKLLLTHYHGDHAGGAAWFREKTGCQVYIGAKEAPAMAAGDEVANSISLAKGGFYPADYTFRGCPVTPLEEGDAVTLGGVSLTAYALPGHSLEGMVYLGEICGKQCLFTGDGVFAAGQVLLQSLHDVSIPPYVLGMEKLAGLPVEALFPGHGVFVMENGSDHIQKAVAKFRSGLLPNQLYYFV